MAHMKYEDFNVGVSSALNALQYDVSPADTMVRLVEKYGLNKEDAFLCVCGAMAILKSNDRDTLLPEAP